MISVQTFLQNLYVGGGSIIGTGSGMLLDRIASSSTDTVRYRLDRQEHTATPSYYLIRTRLQLCHTF